MLKIGTKTLLEGIHAHLDNGACDQLPEISAASYASECREVNERLVRVGEMLDAGSESQALQYAESSPRLLARASELSFGREDELQEFCRDRGLEVAPLIDADGVERLQSIYEGGFSSGHPLYKEYRAAALSKDDAKAYELARLIVQMNPGDTNAERELVRLQKKKVIALFERLKQAGREDDVEALLASQEELERVASSEDLQKEPAYKNALEKRLQIECEILVDELPSRLDEMEDLLTKEDSGWRDAAVSHAEIASRIQELGVSVSDDQEDRFQRLESEIDKGRQESTRKARVVAICRELGAIADEVQTRSVTPLGLDKHHAAEQLQSILELERELTSLRSSLPKSDDKRRAVVRAQLEQILERGRKRLRLRLVVGSMAVFVILLAGATYSFLAHQAKDREKLLRDLHANGEAAAASKLIAELHGPDSHLLKFSGLAAELAATERWLGSVDSLTEQVEDQLAMLGEEVANGFSGTASGDLVARLKEVGALVQTLPIDRLEENASRLATIRNEADRHLRDLQKESEEQAIQVVANVESAMDGIDFEGPAPRAGSLIQEGLDLLEPFVGMSAADAPVLRLPATTESKVADLSSRLEKILSQTQQAKTGINELELASTPETYKEALLHLAGTPFKEGALAQKIVDHFPDDKSQRAFLLFRSDLEALAASEHLPDGSYPLPKVANQAARDIVQKLQSEVLLSNVWSVELKSLRSGTADEIISKGELIHDGNEWSGEVAAYPTSPLLEPRFEKKTFTETSYELSNQPSATTRMMMELRLGELLDFTGTEYQKSVVLLIDRIFSRVEAPALAKACVLSHLFTLVRDKELEWGLHLVPNLERDMDEFQNIEMTKGRPSTYSWLATKKPEEAEVWEAYFKSRQSRRYYRTLLDMVELVQAVRPEEVSVIGKVSAEGVISLSSPASFQVAWGVCRASDGAASLRVFGEVAPGQKELELPVDVLPLSPIFGLPIGNKSRRGYLLSLHGIAPVTFGEE